MATVDRLVFYNAYACWREARGKEGCNLQDSRYGFRNQMLEIARIFARRAMEHELPKKVRMKDIDRMRSVVRIFEYQKYVIYYY